MEMEANIDVLSSLQNFYRRLVRDRHIDFDQGCQDQVRTFASQVDDVVQIFKSQIACSKAFSRIASDRETLVGPTPPRLSKIANTIQIHQHLQNQSTARMEEMAKHMLEFAEDSRKDAITMRIVSVITLIYLPATFVSVSSPTQNLAAAH